jgi:uncharacterized alpha-E superfamily protein
VGLDYLSLEAMAMIRRELSTKTWEELDEVVSKIRTRAEAIKDDELCGLADRVSALMRQLSMQYLIEDEKAGQGVG